MSDPRVVDLVAGARPNFMKVAPILRAMRTERPVTVSLGTNTVVGDEIERAWPLAQDVLAGRYKMGQAIRGWDGKAAEGVVAALLDRYAG